VRLRLLAAAGVLLVLAGCGGGSDDELTVYAAASLTDVLEQLEPDARYNFAGSDELATQLREGAEADIYAAASPKYPGELRAEGIVDEPQTFATNRLVLVVPASNPAGIESLADVGREGVKLVVAAEGVPIGDYSREVLEKAGRTKLLERVVSEEEDVRGVLGKVALGEADAGFVYATDAKAAGDDVRAIELSGAIQTDVRYPVAVVSDTSNEEAARAFVELLLSDEGRQALREAGFGLP
jgi:molybdate transport system substrate-binding protein